MKKPINKYTVIDVKENKILYEHMYLRDIAEKMFYQPKSLRRCMMRRNGYFNWYRYHIEKENNDQ